MFKDPLKGIVLGRSDLDVFFPNIRIENFGDDESMRALLRFLLYGRMRDYGISVLFKNATVDQFPPAEVPSDTLEFVSVYGDLNKFTNTSKDSMITAGFVHMEYLTEYLRSNLQAMPYVDAKNRRTVVFVERMTYQGLHFLETTIPKLIPWFFQDKPIAGQTEEATLLNSLTDPQSDGHLLRESLERFAKANAFEDKLLREQILQIESEERKIKIIAYEEKIKGTRGRINDYQNAITDLLKTYHNDSETLEMLKCRTEKDTAGFADYLIRNQSVQVERIKGMDIYFRVYGVLENFDTDALAAALNKTESIWCQNVPIDSEDVKSLMEAIFIDQKYFVRVCASFMLSLDGSYNNTSAQTTWDDPTYLANPHLKDYECMGGYIALLNDAMIASDFIEAAELCIASTKSLNMTDYTVDEKFAQYLFNIRINDKILSTVDGQLITPAQAISKLKEEKQSESV